MKKVKMISRFMLLAYITVSLCSSLLNVTVSADGLTDASAGLYVSLSKGSVDIGDTFNEKFGTTGNMNIIIIADEANLNGGRIEISDYTAPVTINTSLSGNPYVLNSGVSGTTFYINLKPLNAGSYITFSLPFTTNMLNKNQAKYIKNDVNIQLKGELSNGVNTKTVLENKQVHFDYFLDAIQFAATKSVQMVKTNLAKTKVTINYRMQLTNNDYQTSQCLSSLKLTDQIPDLIGNAPLSAKITSFTNLSSNAAYTENFDAFSKTFTMNLYSSVADRGFQLTSNSAYIYFDVEYDMPDSSLLNANTTGNLTNTIYYEAMGYDHPDHLSTQATGNATANYPLKSISGTVFTQLTYTENYHDVPTALINHKFSAFTYYNFSLTSNTTLEEMKDMEIYFTGLYYSSKSNAGTYKKIEDEKITLTKFTVSNLSAGVSIGVYDLIGNKLADMTSTAPFIVPEGSKITDFKFIPSKPITNFNIYMYYDLNEKFIDGLTQKEKDSDLAYLKSEAHLSITDQNNLLAVDQNTVSNSVAPFLYSIMSHKLSDVDNVALSDEYIQKTYCIDLPYSASVLNVTNPVIYIVFPKEVIVSNPRINSLMANNIYDEFDVTFYTLSDGSAAMKFSGKNYYPTNANHFKIYFDIDMKAAPNAINGTYTLKSYSFSDEKVYSSVTTVNRDYLNGLSTTLNSYSFYATVGAKVSKIEGANLNVYTSLDGQNYYSPNLATVDRGENYKFNVPFLNNSAKKIRNAKVFVRLPFQGNTNYDGSALNSDANSFLTKALILPAALQSAEGKVYYTDAEVPGENMEEDGWTQTPLDFTSIKNVCIDFGNYTISAYEYFDFMSFDMKVSADSLTDAKGYGTVKMKLNLEGVGELNIVSAAAGIDVPDYNIRVENYVTDRLGNNLLTIEVPNNPTFPYTLKNTETNVTYEINLKANGIADIKDIPSGTYTISRPHVPNIEEPTYGTTSQTVTISKKNPSGIMKIYNMLYEPYPVVVATIYMTAETNLNHDIPGSTQTGVVYTSSDPSIAVVSEDGTVQGISEGTATVTVKNNIGDIIGIEIITVISPVTIQSQVYVSETINLNHQVPGSNDPGVTFESATPLIASVNHLGTITGEQKGNAVITVKNSEGIVIGLIHIEVLERDIVLTPTPGEEATATETAEATAAPTPGEEATATETAEATVTPAPSEEATATETAEATAAPTPSEEATATEIAEATATPTPSEEATATETAEATVMPAPSEEATATETAEATATLTPSEEATATETANNISVITVKPVVTATANYINTPVPKNTSGRDNGRADYETGDMQNNLILVLLILLSSVIAFILIIDKKHIIHRFIRK